MIFDDTLIFSKAQAVTVTAPSTNTIDVGVNGTPYGASSALVRDLGGGPEIPLAAQVVTTFTGGTSLQAVYQVADDTAFSVNLDNVIASAAVPVAALVAGYQFSLNNIPYRSRRRYHRLNWVAAGTFTTGAVTAGIVSAVQQHDNTSV